MTARQQTHLLQFFEGKDHPTFVVTKDGKLTFSNGEAVSLYQRSGSIEVSHKAPIFYFLPGDGAESMTDNYVPQAQGIYSLF
jgi:hypothetical protein